MLPHPVPSGLSKETVRPGQQWFTPRRASSHTRRRSVRVAPIAEDSSLLPPVGVWAVLNPSVADHPLRPATDRRLGGPLPRQQANRPRTPPAARTASCPTARFLRPRPLPKPTVCGLSRHFWRVSPTPGQVMHVLRTRPPLIPWPKPKDPSDLHVLRTPPAFVLSQDQTLQENSLAPSNAVSHERGITTSGIIKNAG